VTIDVVTIDGIMTVPRYRERQFSNKPDAQDDEKEDTLLLLIISLCLIDLCSLHHSYVYHFKSIFEISSLIRNLLQKAQSNQTKRSKSKRGLASI